MQNYFQRLEQALKIRDLKKRALAAHLGVALSTISRWREAAPRAETVQKTADWLGVDAKWLMTGEAFKKPGDRDPVVVTSVSSVKEFSDECEKNVCREDEPTLPGDRMADMELRLSRLEKAVGALIDLNRAGDALDKLRKEMNS